MTFFYLAWKYLFGYTRPKSIIYSLHKEFSNSWSTPLYQNTIFMTQIMCCCVMHDMMWSVLPNSTMAPIPFQRCITSLSFQSMNPIVFNDMFYAASFLLCCITTLGWCWLSLTQQICLYMLYLSHRSWATGIPRAFDVRYNAYTQSIEVLQHKDQVLNLVKDIRGKCDQWVRLLGVTVSYQQPYHAAFTTHITAISIIWFSWIVLGYALIWYFRVK